MNQVERKVVVTNLEQEEKETKTPDTEEAKAGSEEVAEEATRETGAAEEVHAEEEVVAEEDQDETETSPEVTEEVTAEEEAEEAVAEETPEEPAAEVEETDEAGEDSENDEASVAAAYYKEIIVKAEGFIAQDDWSFISNELANLALHLEEGPKPDSEEAKKLIKKFNTLHEEFEEKRREHYEELNQKKAANLEAKKELLKQFSDIINEEKWMATKEVSQIRGKWESIKLLPHNEVDALNERFHSLMEEFEDHKVDRLVKKLQKEEENLTLKLVILEKMDKLNEKVTGEGADFDELNTEFHDLLVQWRKIGRVPVEKNQEVWDHFNKAQDEFSELRFKHDKDYRKSIEKALEKKQKLIKEAEALLDNENIAKAARRVNKLHKQWKKTGNLPQKEENELWEKFKAATDAFNEKKSENIEVLRDQEHDNLEAKLKLIEQAEALKDSEDFDAGHQAMQNLMDEWKKIGPVPRKKSTKIWKQFKGAMDVFYEHRRDHFKDIRKDHKENLQRKSEILDKLKELAGHADPALAVEEAKKLQVEFKDAGHVPLKYKNKIWKQYRELCDVIYGNYRASGSNLGMERRLASEGVEPGARKEIIVLQKELENLRKDISRMDSEIIQYQEAKTYFKPTNKGNKLRDELQDKIDKAEAARSGKKERVSEIRRKISELKSAGNDEEE